MDNPFIGMISMFGFNFAPREWGFCNGAIMGIAQNTTLYSLIGCNFGGDCRVSFGLPDLRARLPKGASVMGTAPGLMSHSLGTSGGWHEQMMYESYMPGHNHPATFTPTGSGGSMAVDASQSPGTTKSPASGDLVASAPALGTTFNLYVDNANKGTTVALGGVTGGSGGTGVVGVSTTGSAQTFSIMNPVTAVNYSIAMDGVYPSRN